MRKRDDIDEKTWRLVRRIAKNIRAIRTAKGFTQEDMADFGFGPRWYQRFESGTHMPTIPTLAKLARAFKVEVAELFR